MVKHKPVFPHYLEMCTLYNQLHAEDDSSQNKHTKELFNETTFPKFEGLIQQFILFSGIIFKNGDAYCISTTK